METKTNFTMVETKSNRKTAIAIRPYFDQQATNMGLEDHGMSLFDGVTHNEQLACLEINGVLRYVTGLNEFAPEVKILPLEAKEARVRQIRESVAELEKELASNIVDPGDKDFWNKIELLKPSNSEFWNKIDITCGNQPLYLDPVKPFDRIKLYAIEAGGFSMIAKSYEDARSQAVPPKFYLDKEEPNRSCFLALREVDASSPQYKRSTPLDVIYENMDRHISGDGSESNKERAAKSFIEATKLDMETLKIKSVVRDSIFFKYISTKSDGHVYHTKTQSMLGRNVSDVIEHLKNPLNEDILTDLVEECEKYWNV